VNGVQCDYIVPDGAGESYAISSPEYFSSNDSPVKRTLSLLSEGRQVVGITVRYGALIDSITLRLSDGSEFFAGGSGGGEMAQVIS
jgi:hypothetical protein